MNTNKIRFLIYEGKKSGIRIYNLMIGWSDLDGNLCLVIAYKHNYIIDLKRKQ